MEGGLEGGGGLHYIKQTGVKYLFKVSNCLTQVKAERAREAEAYEETLQPRS